VKRTLKAMVFLGCVLLVGVTSLFVIQNGERTVDLSLDFGIWAAHLKEPVEVPVLMGITLAVGIVLGALPLASWGMRLRRRLRLSDQVTSEADSGGQEWT
jgi:hypothetical protein